MPLSNIIKIHNKLYTVDICANNLHIQQIINGIRFNNINVPEIIQHFWCKNFKIKHIRSNQFDISKCDLMLIQNYIKSHKVIYWSKEYYHVLDFNNIYYEVYKSFISKYDYLIYAAFLNNKMVPIGLYSSYDNNEKIFVDESYYQFGDE